MATFSHGTYPTTRRKNPWCVETASLCPDSLAPFLGRLMGASMFSATLVWRRYRAAIPAIAIVLAIAIAAAWPFFSNFEAHRAGYISGVLKRGFGCGTKISASAQERLQHYMQANVVAFTAGSTAGATQVDKTREAVGSANMCRLLVERYARAAERPLLIASPSELTETQWPLLLVSVFALLLLLLLFRPAIRQRMSLVVTWPRVLFGSWLLVAASWAVFVAIEASGNWPHEPIDRYALESSGRTRIIPPTPADRAAHVWDVALFLAAASGLALGPAIALVWIVRRSRREAPAYADDRGSGRVSSQEWERGSSIHGGGLGELNLEVYSRSRAPSQQLAAPVDATSNKP